jgi:thioredoxin reductase
MTERVDRSSLAGKIELPTERAQVLVVGAGPAGLSASIEAARLGAKVTVVDENPVDPALMALDIPLFFGGRMSGVVEHPGKVVEQMFAADPCFEEAMEFGVDVRLGVTAWGLYVNGGALQALPVPMVALADRAKSWMCGFEKLILATGSRDIALALPGWAQPGVMGVVGFQRLIDRYDAFSGQRVVILGSGSIAMSAALLAVEHGLEVAALVEVAPDVLAGTELADRVRAARIPILTSHVPLKVESGPRGLERLVVMTPEQKVVAVEADTVCMAFGRAPAIELLSGAGAQVVGDSYRGGYVPILNRWKTTISEVFVAGDCAGLAASSAEAAEQGRDAARQALGATTTETVRLTGDAWNYQAAWLRAITARCDDSLVICQCENVTHGDLVAVRAPGYVQYPRSSTSTRTLEGLLADGPANPDQIKRLTRACMGVCQARRCREQVALLLAQASGVAPDDIPLATYRPPVRPLPLSVIADVHETAEMSSTWRAWFDIPGQLAAYDDIGTEREFRDVFGGDL